MRPSAARRFCSSRWSASRACRPISCARNQSGEPVGRPSSAMRAERIAAGEIAAHHLLLGRGEARARHVPARGIDPRRAGTTRRDCAGRARPRRAAPARPRRDACRPRWRSAHGRTGRRSAAARRSARSRGAAVRARRPRAPTRAALAPSPRGNTDCPARPRAAPRPRPAPRRSAHPCDRRRRGP